MQFTLVVEIAVLDLTCRTVEADRRAEADVQMLRTKQSHLITCRNRRTRLAAASMADAPRAGTAPVVKSSAQEAGFEDILKGDLHGSATIVKLVFAPSPHAAETELVEAAKQPVEALIEPIFKPKFGVELCGAGALILREFEP